VVIVGDLLQLVEITKGVLLVNLFHPVIHHRSHDQVREQKSCRNTGQHFDLSMRWSPMSSNIESVAYTSFASQLVVIFFYDTYQMPKAQHYLSPNP
jgi:hypothetical protein